MIVAKFLSWIETAPVERRAEATSALVRAYLVSSMEPYERDAAETALTILLDDPSPMVRSALAHGLANSPHAPRQVILSLMDDIDAIAVPVVASSPVILDGELADLISRRGPVVQGAIAKRPSVSPSLSNALSQSATMEACQVLLKNPGAQISVSSLRRIAERFGGHADIRNTLLAMPGLPVDIRQTLIMRLGDALEQLSLVRSFVNSERRAVLVKDACEKATIDLAFCCSEGKEMTDLVEHLRSSGQLTADILIRGLCMGNIELFIASMVALSGMSRRRVSDCVRDASRSAILALCQKSGISERVANMIAIALNSYHSLIQDGAGGLSRKSFARLMVDLILRAYNGSVDNEMDDLLTLIRRFEIEIARDEARAMRLKLQQQADAA